MARGDGIRRKVATITSDGKQRKVATIAADAVVAAEDQEKKTNQVLGKVLLKETNVGIPDLLVEIYGVDPSTRSGEIINSSPASGSAVMPEISAGRRR